MLAWKLPAEVSQWLTHLSQLLHRRQAGRLLPLLAGRLFAQGRRTVTSWLRAAAIGKGFPRYYSFLGSLGRQADFVASLLLRQVATALPLGERIVLGLDDSPTQRPGPHVEGAGIHPNPTPGPANPKVLYGHVWGTLAWLVRHPCWGALGLPLRARLYVRRKDIGQLAPCYGVPFQTKLQQGAALVTWAADWLKYLGKVGAG